jgi:hypothetical protein
MLWGVLPFAVAQTEGIPLADVLRNIFKWKRVFRAVVIGGGTLLMLNYGLEQTQGLLAASLVLVGACTIGWGWSTIWK